MSPRGVLNLNKPSGPTSFDVVRDVRRATGIRRVGHAGTLDPLASGVLLVCVGQATRIISYLQDAPKVYLAGIRLGQRTTTYDSEGDITEELAVPDQPDLSRLIGDVWQTPPVYSALKRAGRPLYDYARKGEAIDVQPRLVRIERIDIVDWQPPLVSVRVWCGKGTYIRSLANDLGGHLASLVREAVGAFRIEDALPLDRLAAWENELVPLSRALAGLPRLELDGACVTRVRNGLAIEGPAGDALAVDGSGAEVAILREGRPKIVFRDPLPSPLPVAEGG